MIELLLVWFVLSFFVAGFVGAMFNVASRGEQDTMEHEDMQRAETKSAP